MPDLDIDPGQLRHRLEIQAVTETQNDIGQLVQTWVTIATRWGSVEPLSGREQWLAQQAQAAVSHKIHLRYYAGLTPKHRLKWGTRIFEIGSVLNPGEQHAQTPVELMVQEKV